MWLVDRTLSHSLYALGYGRLDETASMERGANRARRRHSQDGREAEINRLLGKFTHEKLTSNMNARALK